MFSRSCKKNGLVRESNPGPLAPKARIMPLDQQATLNTVCYSTVFIVMLNTQHSLTDLVHKFDTLVNLGPNFIILVVLYVAAMQ